MKMTAISGALLKSQDESRLVHVLQWESESDYTACFNDPKWADIPSSRRFQELVSAGEAKTDVRIYTVVAVSESPGVEK